MASQYVTLKKMGMRLQRNNPSHSVEKGQVNGHISSYDDFLEIYINFTCTHVPCI